MLSFQRIPEGRTGWFSAGDALDEVSDLVDEAVLVADLQAGHPPLVHVRMFAAVIGNVDGAPAAEFPLILVIEVLKAMKIMQVPRDAGFLAVDLKCVKRLVSTRVAGALKSRQ